MRFRFGWMIFAVSAMASLAHAADDAVPTGKLPDTAAPVSYALKLKIDPREERFSGQAKIRIKLAKAADHVWLHGQDLTVTGVELTDAAGKAHKATYTGEKEGVAKIAFDTSLAAQEIQVTIDYNTAFNSKLEGLYKVKVGDDSYAITQMEAISARYAFPGFDEPRFKTPFDISLTVRTGHAAISNAPMVT